MLLDRRKNLPRPGGTPNNWEFSSRLRAVAKARAARPISSDFRPKRFLLPHGSRAGAELFTSRLAQLVERKTLNLVVVGSSPTVGGRAAEPRALFYLV